MNGTSGLPPGCSGLDCGIVWSGVWNCGEVWSGESVWRSRCRRHLLPAADYQQKCAPHPHARTQIRGILGIQPALAEKSWLKWLSAIALHLKATERHLPLDTGKHALP